MPGTRHYGTLGRNVLTGPTYKQWDLAIYKNTDISERLKLQLRADFFNILNHPNFANPELPAFIADPAANLTSACGCGFVQANGGTREVGNGGYNITATGDVGIGNPFLGGGAPARHSVGSEVDLLDNSSAKQKPLLRRGFLRSAASQAALG